MKSILTVFVACISFIGAFAEAPSSRVRISIQGNSDIRVLIDNRHYSENDNDIVINNLSPGRHTIQVYRAKNIRNNKRWRKSRKDELLYSSTIIVKPNHSMDILIDRYGQVRIDEDRDRWYRNDRRDDDWRSRDRRDDDWRGRDRSDDDWRERRDRYDNRNDHRQAVSNAAFQTIMERLGREFFEAVRLDHAKKYIDNNYFTNAQLRQMERMFSNDKYRREFQQYAYRR
jgi:hypothetical protein